MARKGRELERLVKVLEKNTHEIGATVLSPAYLIDKTTGEKREIDVLISYGSGRHKRLTAIECKDWKAKVDVKVVDEFWAKLGCLNINKGIIVSSSGFTQPALTKAEFYNISCLHMEDLESLEWLPLANIVVLRKVVTKCNFKINIDFEFVNGIKNPKIILSNGNEFNKNIMKINAISHVNKISIDGLESDKTYRELVKFHPKDFKVIDVDLEKEYPAVEVFMYVEYILETQLYDIKRIKYTDITEGEVVCNAAFANIDIGKEKSGYLTLIQLQDGSVKVAYEKS
ncbi:restriction endonuclease [Hahella sp. CR1]|uniref:restriction endonuclease n=1 Tax=Hahella sp. CR1 TaxID=2992807 RepID=UPI00244255CE|nr:restriction endonuclease [Hahella sp. CR1]MDG9671797.1 restriction endonuclease [Hahella sp. CR1]